MLLPPDRLRDRPHITGVIFPTASFGKCGGFVWQPFTCIASLSQEDDRDRSVTKWALSADIDADRVSELIDNCSESESEESGCARARSRFANSIKGMESSESESDLTWRWRRANRDKGV